MCFKSFLFCMGLFFIYSNVFCMEPKKNVFSHGDRYPSRELFIREPFEPTLKTIFESTLETIEEEQNVNRLRLIRRNCEIFNLILNHPKVSDLVFGKHLVSFCKNIEFNVDKEKNIGLRFLEYLTSWEIEGLVDIEKRLLNLMRLILVKQGEEPEI